MMKTITYTSLMDYIDTNTRENGETLELNAIELIEKILEEIDVDFGKIESFKTELERIENEK